jgi:hypothetical protein
MHGEDLTLLRGPRKNNNKVSFIQDNFYAQWRIESGLVTVLREDAESPPERLLQAIWQHQRLLRDQLRTLDGQPVRVLHPGFHNLEGGPDFRQAVVQIADSMPCEGDVEVDLRSSGWHAHGHDRNPAFHKVVLHVIWESERPAAGAPPLLCLKDFLDAPLGELSRWLGGETAQVFPEELRGKCCAPLRSLSNERLMQLLHQAAHVRLRSKAALFQARARQAGWEQSLWEGLFRALGYKHNVWPMQRLGELRPRWLTGPNEAQTLQARLLGLSGLLPVELSRAGNGADLYLRGVWDQWWRERDEFSDVTLPRALWRLHGLRPANHPQRRLALAAGWSVADCLTTKLERWCGKSGSENQIRQSLVQALQVAPDDFWSWHWTLKSSRLKREQPLLGATRVADFAMNVVIPWLWIRAVEGKSGEMQAQLEERYFNWPPAEDNSVLRLARERLLGRNDKRLLTTAAAQQGLIQLVRDFCDHSNSICHACKLPELVRDFCGSGEGKTKS